MSHQSNAVKQQKWTGKPPTECQLCNAPITSVFVDGRIQGVSQWAFMCPLCHSTDGVGLGVGLGQKYVKSPDGSFVKM